MQFSAMTMNMWFPSTDDGDDDNRIIEMAAEQSIWFAELGYHVWFTDHHFRGPWHSNPLQFASYIAPLIPRDRYLGFGVLSIPFYHPVRLVESINLLDHLTKGRVLIGVGSGDLTHVEHDASQLDLFASPRKYEKLGHTLDEIREKFGHDSLRRGSQLLRGKKTSDGADHS